MLKICVERFYDEGKSNAFNKAQIVFSLNLDLIDLSHLYVVPLDPSL